MCALDEWTVDELAALVRRARQLRRALRRRARVGARPARRPLPVRRVRRAAAAHRVGPRRRHRPRPRRARSGSRSRAAARSPTAACSACSCPTAPASASSTRRWSTRAAPGETFLLGASTWRIEEITFERVVVTPGARASRARCRSGTATGPGRPLELGRALGAFVRELRGAAGATAPAAPARRHGLDELRRRQPAAVPRRAGRGHRRGARRPHDRRRALPRRDRRLAGVHAHRRSARRCTRRGRWRSSAGSTERCGMPVEMMWSDDGIVLRLPEAVDELPLDELLIDPDEIDELVVVDAAAARRCSRRGSASARRGRCCCRAAGPIGARRCGSSASGPPTCWRSRPSTRRSRSCSRPRASACSDVFDLPALREVLSRAARSRQDPDGRRRHAEGVAVRAVAAVRLDRRLHVRGRRAAGRAPGRRARARPRPAARPARRRGAARAASTRRCSPTSSSSCSGSSTDRRARDADELHDLLRRARRPHARRARRRAAARRRRRAELDRRSCVDDAARDRGVGSPASERFAAAEDAARLRDALGVRAARSGCPRRSPTRSTHPLDDLVARYARTHGPFLARGAAAPLRRRPRAGRGVARGARGRRPCRARRVPARRRRARVVRRRGAAPAAAPVAGRAAPRGRAGRRRGAAPGSCPRGTASDRRAARLDGLVEVLGHAAGRADPGVGARGRRAAGAAAAATGRADLDALCTSGEVVWVGAGPLGASDGGCGSSSATRCALLAPVRRTTTPRPSGRGARRRCAPIWLSAARRSGPTCAPAADRRPPTPRCSPRCGISCGPARSPTTRSRRCGRCCRAKPASGRAPKAAAVLARAGSRASGRPPAPGGGRSCRAAGSSPRRPPTEAAHASALQLLERYGVAHPRGGAGRGRRGRVRRRVPAC